jgi:hypothetical protein
LREQISSDALTSNFQKVKVTDWQKVNGPALTSQFIFRFVGSSIKSELMKKKFLDAAVVRFFVKVRMNEGPQSKDPS